jgi:hypothetical protein
LISLIFHSKVITTAQFDEPKYTTVIGFAHTTMVAFKRNRYQSLIDVAIVVGVVVGVINLATTSFILNRYCFCDADATVSSTNTKTLRNRIRTKKNESLLTAGSHYIIKDQRQRHHSNESSILTKHLNNSNTTSNNNNDNNDSLIITSQRYATGSHPNIATLQNQTQNQQQLLENDRTMLVTTTKSEGNDDDDEYFVMINNSSFNGNYVRIQIEPFTLFLYPLSIQFSTHDSFVLLSTMEDIIYKYLQQYSLLNNNNSQGTTGAVLDTVRLGNIQTGFLGNQSNTSGTSSYPDSKTTSDSSIFTEESDNNKNRTSTAFLHVEKGKVSISGLPDAINSIPSYQVNKWVQEALQKSNILDILQQQKQIVDNSQLQFDVNLLKEVYFEFSNVSINNNNDTMNNIQSNPSVRTAGQENRAKDVRVYYSTSVIAGIAVACIVVTCIAVFFIARRHQRSRSVSSNSLENDVRVHVLKIGKLMSNDTAITTNEDNYHKDLESSNTVHVYKTTLFKKKQQQQQEQQYNSTSNALPDTPERTVDTTVSMVDEHHDIISTGRRKKNTIFADSNQERDTITTLVRKGGVTFHNSVTPSLQQQQLQQQQHHFRASPTPSSWCGSESEWSVSTETNDTNILKSIHNLGHAYGIEQEHELKQQSQRAVQVPPSRSTSLNRLINDVEVDTNNVPSFHQGREPDATDSNWFSRVLRQHHSHVTNSNDVDICGIPAVVTPGDEEIAAVMAGTSTIAGGAAGTTTMRSTKRPISRVESFEMDRPVSIQKDMLANSWAGTFHKRMTKLPTMKISDSTNNNNEDDNNCGVSLPLLKSNSWRTNMPLANNQEGKHDGNRFNDIGTSSACRTKSIKSKKMSTSLRSNTNSGTSVLQPNHFSVKSERIARKRRIKTEQSDIDRRLLANIGLGNCDDFDNNGDDDDDDGDSIPPELGPWGTGSSAADTDDSDVNTDDDDTIEDHTKKRLFTEDISNC